MAGEMILIQVNRGDMDNKILSTSGSISTSTTISSSSNSYGEAILKRYSYEYLIQSLSYKQGEEEKEPRKRQLEEAVFPYTVMEEKEMRRVHTFVAAVQASSTDSSPSARADDDSSAHMALMGVVGLVYVRLRGGEGQQHSIGRKRGREAEAEGHRAVPVPAPVVVPVLVEAYVQIVVCFPLFRRQGVMRRVFDAVLHLRVVLSGLFKVENDEGDDSGAAMTREMCVLRYRLHTLMSSKKTEEYIKKYFSLVFPQRGGPEGFSLDDYVNLLSRVNRFYKDMGFVERRFLYKFYDHEGDGVEMVKTVKP